MVTSIIYYLTIVFTWSPAVHTKLYLCLKAMLLGFFKSGAAHVSDCTILEDPTIFLKSLSKHSLKDIDDIDDMDSE